MATSKPGNPDSVRKNFAPCELDDPKPSPTWEPSPQQIERWARQIRAEREAERLVGPPGALGSSMMFVAPCDDEEPGFSHWLESLPDN